MPKCYAENNHVFVSVKGTAGLCCSNANPGFKTIKEFKESEFFNEWKTNMENGWHPTCKSCQKKEEFGQDSKRTYFEQCKYYVEYSEDNSCNLSCIMCNEKYSSTWEKKKGIKFNHQTFDKDEIEWDKIDLFKYMGGEPFMTKGLLSILEKIPDEATVWLSTNLTFFPKKKILDQLKRFATVQLSCSVDGLNGTFEYIRNGANWEECKKNLIKFRDSEIIDRIYLVMTVQALNIHEVSKVAEFAKEHDIKFQRNFLFDPYEYSIEALPLHYRELIKDEMNEMYLNVPFIPERFKLLKKAIEYNKNILGSDISKIPQIDTLICM